LENTWFPRVTEAPDEADDDGCPVDDPAAAVITLETSAAADATTVDAALGAVDAVLFDVVDAGFDVVDAELGAVDAGLDVVDAPVAVPVVCPDVAFSASDA
jgi:hypothetical protein